MDELSQLFKILSDKNRLRIVSLLSQKKLCVCELAAILNVSQPSISRHIKRMKNAGLICDEKDGFWTNYYLQCQGDKAKIILDNLNSWLKEDEIALSDLRKLENIDRTKICCA